MQSRSLFDKLSILKPIHKAVSKIMANNGETDASEDAQTFQQPFSDGSEEFFEQFIPRDEFGRPLQKRNLYISLGLTLGVIAGAGTVLWIRKEKDGRSWVKRLLGM